MTENELPSHRRASGSQIGEIFEVTSQAVLKWGLPRYGSHKKTHYDLRDAVRHLKNKLSSVSDDDIDIKKETARLTKYRADIAELDFQQASEELIDADEALSGYKDILSIVRTAFVSLPDKMALSLENTDAGSIKEKLDAEITQILNNIVQRISDVEKKQ
jgi:phage terminase Nu1 subunit (DNA packaging protein)